MVTGSIPSNGRASALISQVPPESMRHGADAFMGLRSSILLTDEGNGIMYR